MRDLLTGAAATPAAITEQHATIRAWELWRQHSCEETNGGHPWVLHVFHGRAHIGCEASCGATPDLGVDSTLLVNACIPVTVDVETARYQTDYGTGWESDMWVTIEPDLDRIPRRRSA